MREKHQNVNYDVEKELENQKKKILRKILRNVLGIIPLIVWAIWLIFNQKPLGVIPIQKHTKKYQNVIVSATLNKGKTHGSLVAVKAKIDLQNTSKQAIQILSYHFYIEGIKVFNKEMYNQNGLKCNQQSASNSQNKIRRNHEKTNDIFLIKRSYDCTKKLIWSADQIPKSELLLNPLKTSGYDFIFYFPKNEYDAVKLYVYYQYSNWVISDLKFRVRRIVPKDGYVFEKIDIYDSHTKKKISINDYCKNTQKACPFNEGDTSAEISLWD